MGTFVHMQQFNSLLKKKHVFTGVNIVDRLLQESVGRIRGEASYELECKLEHPQLAAQLRRSSPRWERSVA